jgi:hypothetical protein
MNIIDKIFGGVRPRITIYLKKRHLTEENAMVKFQFDSKFNELATLGKIKHADVADWILEQYKQFLKDNK